MKGCRGIYILALCLTVVCQSMYIITPYFTQQITDTFIVNENALLNLQEHTDTLIFMLASMVGFTLVRCGIQYGSNMMYEHSSQMLIYRVRKVLFDKIENQDAAFYNVYRTGDIMTRVTSDLDMVRHSIAWIIKTMVECVVLFSASLIFFFTMDWLMALCLIALTPVILFITWLFKRKAGPMYVDLREKLSRMNTAAEENISGNRVVKAFAREEYEISQFDKYSQEYSKANKKAAFVWLKFFPFLETTAQSLSVVMLVAGGLFVVFGRISLGQYAAFSGLIWTLSNPMRTLGNIVNDLQRFSASANKIIEIYYGSPRIVDRNDAVDKPGRFDGKVEFDHVSFSYGDTKVLDDISFTVEPGQTVVIMGETGSGKTTLAELIPRIYDVQGGEVRVDGVNVSRLKLKQLRHNIGFATQDVLLYSDTIDGNISFGDSGMSEEDVVKYAKAADADNFVRKLSDGYETIVGERGVGLSGGQKQRISLARALAVKPAVLILDDTTSAVDLETEKHIQNSLANLDFPCTKIIIAQRISTAKYADKIIVLKDGKILEQGTHDELIKNSGYYREVYDLQK
ncbi:aBC transporter ATP-binding protein [Eubacterium sp. CAG:786]|nr:aBC transporter ATP-binding protein [Eubacterium sp. CAG:786]